MHYAFLDGLDRIVGSFEERFWKHAHINHQEQQRDHQPDLAPAKVGERLVSCRS